MASAVWLVIFGMIFYFIKNMYQKVVLKKSDDEILFEKLGDEAVDSLNSWNLFKSKEKVKEEDDARFKKMNELRTKIENDKAKNI